MNKDSGSSFEDEATAFSATETAEDLSHLLNDSTVSPTAEELKTILDLKALYEQKHAGLQLELGRVLCLAEELREDV